MSDKVVLLTQWSMPADMLPTYGPPSDQALLDAGLTNLIGQANAPPRALAIAMGKWAAKKARLTKQKKALELGAARKVSIVAKPALALVSWDSIALELSQARSPGRQCHSVAAKTRLGSTPAQLFGWKEKQPDGSYTPSSGMWGGVGDPLDWPCVRVTARDVGVTQPAWWSNTQSDVVAQFRSGRDDVTILNMALSAIDPALFVPPAEVGNATVASVRRTSTQLNAVSTDGAGAPLPTPKLTASIKVLDTLATYLGGTVAERSAAWKDAIQLGRAAMSSTVDPDLRASILDHLVSQGVSAGFLNWASGHPAPYDYGHAAANNDAVYLFVVDRNDTPSYTLKRNTTKLTYKAPTGASTYNNLGTRATPGGGVVMTAIEYVAAPAGTDTVAEFDVWAPMPEYRRKLVVYKLRLQDVNFDALLAAADKAAADGAITVTALPLVAVYDGYVYSRAADLALSGNTNTENAYDAGWRAVPLSGIPFAAATYTNPGVRTGIQTGMRTDTSSMVATTEHRVFVFDGYSCGFVDVVTSANSFGETVVTTKDKVVQSGEAYTVVEPDDSTRTIYKLTNTDPKDGGVSVADTGDVNMTVSTTYTALVGSNLSAAPVETDTLYLPCKTRNPLRDPWTIMTRPWAGGIPYGRNADLHNGKFLTGNRDANMNPIVDQGELFVQPGYGTKYFPWQVGRGAAGLIHDRLTTNEYSVVSGGEDISLQRAYTPPDPRGIPLASMMPVYCSPTGAPSWPNANGALDTYVRHIASFAGGGLSVAVSSDASGGPTRWTCPVTYRGAAVYTDSAGKVDFVPETLSARGTLYTAYERDVMVALARVCRMPGYLHNYALAPSVWQNTRIPAYVGAWRSARELAGQPAGLVPFTGAKSMTISYVAGRPNVSSPPHPILDAGAWTRAPGEAGDAATPVSIYGIDSDSIGRQEFARCLPMYEGMLQVDIEAYSTRSVPMLEAGLAGGCLYTAALQGDVLKSATIVNAAPGGDWVWMDAPAVDLEQDARGVNSAYTRASNTHSVVEGVLALSGSAVVVEAPESTFSQLKSAFIIL